MIEIMISKITQAVCLIIASLLALSAELQGASIWDEAAKYGFAVLFMLVVLYLLYKDYKHEKEYSKEEIKRLNKLIAQILEDKIKDDA